MRLFFSGLLVASLAAVPAFAEDWTGPYVGAGVGYSDVNGPGSADGDKTTFGIHAGYDYDFGDFVLGGELEYDRVGLTLPAGFGTVDNVARLKLKGGYDFGPALGYVVLGGARSYSDFGNDNGTLYGIGLAYKVTDQVSLSGEVLHHKFNDIGNTGSDFESNVFNIRASFRF